MHGMLRDRGDVHRVSDATSSLLEAAAALGQSTQTIALVATTTCGLVVLSLRSA